MASPFFTAFLPLASQSAAGAGVGHVQGTVQGMELFQKLAQQQLQNEQTRMQIDQQKALFPIQQQTQQANLGLLPQLLQLELKGKQADIGYKESLGKESSARANMYTGTGMYPPASIKEKMWRQLQMNPSDPEALRFFQSEARMKFDAAAGAGVMPLDDQTLQTMAQESAMDPNYHPTFGGVWGPINKQRFETLRANPNAQLPPNPYLPKQVMPPNAQGQPMPKAADRAAQIIGNQSQTKLMKEAVSEFGPKGKSGQAVKSFDVAISHLETLRNLANALSSNDYQQVNKWSNFFSKQTGSPAVTNFETAKKIVADEVTKAIVGGATALGDREKNEAAFLATASPAQLVGSIDTVLELMRGQIDGLRKSYEANTGRRDFDKLLTEQAKVKQGGAVKAMPVPSKGQAQNQDMAEAREVLKGKDQAYVDKLLKNPKLTSDQKRILQEAWMMEQGQR